MPTPARRPRAEAPALVRASENGTGVHAAEGMHDADRAGEVLVRRLRLLRPMAGQRVRCAGNTLSSATSARLIITMDVAPLCTMSAVFTCPFGCSSRSCRPRRMHMPERLVVPVRGLE